MKTFDLSDCIFKPGKVEAAHPLKNLKKLDWVEALFSINGGEDIRRSYQVGVIDGFINYTQLIDEIVHPFITPEILVTPTTLSFSSENQVVDICAEYQYSVAAISVNLKEVTIL